MATGSPYAPFLCLPPKAAPAYALLRDLAVAVQRIHRDRLAHLPDLRATGLCHCVFAWVGDREACGSIFLP